MNIELRKDNIKSVTPHYPRIKELRISHGIKQKQICAYLNCSQQVYSNYELGQRDIPTSVLILLTEYYNVSADYILGIKD